MLQVKGLRKRYGDLIAVRDATFEVAKGERFGLLGPNGAGKTTTISMITGTLDPDSGEALIDGKPVGTRNADAKRKIGYVPQELALYDEIDARANLRFFAALYGITGAAMERASDRALQVAGLSDRAKEPVKGFSGGMKRRLNIAVALLHDPEILIFDEPTVGVDPQSRNQIFETLLALAGEGKTIVYTTHYMEEVEKLCRRVAVMDHGEIVASGTMAELHQNLGHKGQVRIELADSAPLISLPGVTDLRAEENFLFFTLDDLTYGLAPVLTTLASAGLTILSVRSSAPSLEEIFLSLTGRTLRD